MKILVISSRNKEDEMENQLKERVLSLIKDDKHEYTHCEVSKEDYRSCLGCFNCWVKTPGKCIINDGLSKITEEFVKNDVVLILTRLNYGCYDAAIKRVLDRIIPNVLPFFKIVNNEMHHAARYDKNPEFIMIGYGKDITYNEESIFKELTNANAINFQKEGAVTIVCRNNNDIENVAKELRSYFKTVKEGVA